MNPWYILLAISLVIYVSSYFHYKVSLKRFAQNWITGKKTSKREYVSCCISHQTSSAKHKTEQVVTFLRQHKYIIYRRDNAYVAHTPSNLYRRPFMVKIVTLKNRINVQIKDGHFQKSMGKAGVDIYKKLMFQLCDEIVKVISTRDGSDVDIEVQLGPLSKWEQGNCRGSFFKEHYKQQWHNQNIEPTRYDARF